MDGGLHWTNVLERERDMDMNFSLKIKKTHFMTQKEFLLDTLEYYTTDVNRRCVSTHDACFYSAINAGKEGISDGCAIGRHLPSEEVKLQLDGKGTITAILHNTK